MIGNVKAVVLFEWKRALTLPRMSWSLVLAIFPVFIVSIARFNYDTGDWTDEGIYFVLYALIPMLVAMLGTFLWTTPAVSAELERKSWVYLTVRPYGSTAVLLGKYVAAVTWVIPPAVIAVTASVLIAQPSQPGKAWTILTDLTLLAIPGYAAVYLLIGVVLPKRSMAIAVVYSLVFEVVLSNIPAVINQLTVQYRLRSLLVNWTEMDFGGVLSEQILGKPKPSVLHIVSLLIFTLIMLSLSVVVIRLREFSSAAESDV